MTPSLTFTLSLSLSLSLSLLLLPKKFFDTRTSLQHRSVPRRKFLVLCDKNIWNRISWFTPSMLKLCRYPNLVKHWMVPPPKFRYRATKKDRQNRDSPNIQKFLTAERFWNTEGSPKTFLVMWDKKIETDFRDLPLLCQNFSIPGINETIKGSPTKSFGTVWQKEVRQNRDTLLIHKNPDTRTFLKHRRVALRYFW